MDDLLVSHRITQESGEKSLALAHINSSRSRGSREVEEELQIMSFWSPRPCTSSPDHLVHLVLLLVLALVLGVLGLELVVERCSGG